jgi:single-stranded-DNA-specific exonuclease
MSNKYLLRKKVPEKFDKIFEKYDPLTRSLLYDRGIKNTESAEKFLSPEYEKDLYDPYLLKDMQKVVDRIVEAINKKEKIAIYSDYDADGIPGAVVLYDFFKKIGYENFVNYIPLRNEEGFGLNHEAIDSLVADGVTLLVTIDCGIADVEQIAVAKKHKLDVIITDHHIPGQEIPEAFAIINPKQKDCDYPEKMLCGSGVIFKVVQALIKDPRINFPMGQEKWMLDMVGLATLSDMVPLLGENRALAFYGMKVLQKSPRAGLRRLFADLRIDQRKVTEDDIAFMITPRINAASRMGIPLDAFKLLSTSDETEAGALSLHLNNKNNERKVLVATMVKEIKKKISDRDESMKNVLVLGNPEWKPSLLGLVANSFSDEHNRPVFLWGREGTNGSSIIKGSCRSGGNVSVFELMSLAKDIFMEYGGHSGAGGFSVSEENIHSLEEKLNEAFLKLKTENSDAEILVDKKISVADVNRQTFEVLEKFAPFGFENPKPLFWLENVLVSSVKQFGKEKNHLEIKVRDNSAIGSESQNQRNSEITAIAFFSALEKFSVPIQVGSKINLIATMEKSTFRNFVELRLRIVDIF